MPERPECNGSLQQRHTTGGIVWACSWLGLIWRRFASHLQLVCSCFADPVGDDVILGAAYHVDVIRDQLTQHCIERARPEGSFLLAAGCQWL